MSQYIAFLFHDDREENDNAKALSCESGSSILKEVQWALQNSKARKAAGPDEAIVEVLIALHCPPGWYGSAVETFQQNI